MLSTVEQRQLASRELQQLRQELHASEVRFRNVITKLADAIIIVDSQGLVRFVNPAAECLFNSKAEEILGKEVFGTRVFETKTSEIGTEIMSKVGETNNSGTRVVNTLVEIIRKGSDGATQKSMQPAYAEMRVVETEWEGEMAFIASLRDITYRVVAEEALRQSEARLREQAQQLEQTLLELKRTQSQLIQTEKMSALGELVAGVAHEINNPVNFIYGNIDHARNYIQDLVQLLQLYQKHYPSPMSEIEAETEEIDLEFLIQDLPKLLSSMHLGAERIRQIVLSLRNFSRLDEAQMKRVNIHEGIDSTLLILQNRLKARAGYSGVEIIKEYGDLPQVECYAGQLNQVFMNILSNGIDALEESVVSGQLSLLPNNRQGQSQALLLPTPTIRISTEAIASNSPSGGSFPSKVVIRIADNGNGMTEEVRRRLFDPFFTTKPVGKGTGLGLSISYHIVVEKHGGQLQCVSAPDRGAEFVIEIPVEQPKAKGAGMLGTSSEGKLNSKVPYTAIAC